MSTLIAVQALLSTISGVLMSQMSFVGKVGISLIYREYGLFRLWWKTALLLFALQLALIFILWLVRRISGRRLSVAIILFFLLVALTGAYFTYIDFTTTSHRLMKANFHVGGYLTWVAWLLTCFYFLVACTRSTRASTTTDDTYMQEAKQKKDQPPTD
ncbi:hypothetical protein ACFOET_09155 [Parapedobacter deserti]|uniref:Cytochrome d ubiquinol oxidase subunit II n=1 Tax=Parapedobacter deserti TaxID=1912957 RepID=A0ABV7JI47_9SPHI